MNFSRLTNLKTTLEHFVSSDYFIYFLGLLALTGWVMNIWLQTIMAMLVLCVIPLFLFRNTKHLLAFFMIFYLSISTNRRLLWSSWAVFVIMVLMLIMGIVFNLLRFKRDWSVLSPKSWSGVLFATMFFALSFAFAGVGSTYQNYYANFVGLLYVLLCIVFYAFFVLTCEFKSNSGNQTLCVNNGETSNIVGTSGSGGASNIGGATGKVGISDNGGVTDYVLKILLTVGLIATIEFFVCFIKKIVNNPNDWYMMFVNADLSMGWGGKNNVAPVIAMGCFAAYYLCMKRTKILPLYLVVVFIQYLAILCAFSRGIMLFASIGIFITHIYILIKTQNKKAYCITSCILLIVFIALLVVGGCLIKKAVADNPEFADTFNVIVFKFFRSSGRVEIIYPEAVDVFVKYPVFGAGWGYRLGEFAKDNFTPYWYHSTLFQTLACMGIWGLIGLSYFTFCRYRAFYMQRKNCGAVMLFMASAVFELYAMIDTNFYSPVFFAMLLIASFAVESQTKNGAYKPISKLSNLFKKGN